MLSSKWESYFRVVLVLLLVAQWPSCSSKLSCLPSPSSYGGGSSAEATSCSGWGWTGGGRGKKEENFAHHNTCKEGWCGLSSLCFFDRIRWWWRQYQQYWGYILQQCVHCTSRPRRAASYCIALTRLWQTTTILPHAYTSIHDYPGPANHLHVLTRPDNDKVWWQLMIDLNYYYSILSGARDDDVHRGGGRQWL